MLTAAPHLHVRRPSPTTAEFTVSTHPPNPTLTQRLLLFAVGILRLVLALGAGLLLYAEYWTQFFSLASYQPSNIWLLPAAQHEFLLCHTPPGRLAQDIAAATPAWALVPLCVGALYAAMRRIHVEERLLVLRGLGIQTRSTPGTILLGCFGGGGGSGAGAGGGPTRFIPTEKIRDVLINEAFWGFGGAGEEGLVVVFPKLLPRREIVEEVWRGVRGCLFDEGGGGSGGSGEYQLQQQQQEKKRRFKDTKRRSMVGDGKKSPASSTGEKGEEVRDWS
ncbi:GPI-GlcNAc transferase complex- PIG-H component-domain-containing protein [Apiospora phragmitis]|uniref:GPI-GlcNAc transferase complex- PIG-H component-domain-containing protein n=1 Tax=Apiospora phragmitis TaxID=2905665 RepID=A0ABR1WSQ4_9PEZI